VNAGALIRVNSSVQMKKGLCNEVGKFRVKSAWAFWYLNVLALMLNMELFKEIHVHIFCSYRTVKLDLYQVNIILVGTISFRVK
jgi:hypothetical protein